MALTPSTMLELGTIAPDFSLTNVLTEKITSLEQLKGIKATIVMFICCHCPYVKHINEGLALLGTDYANKPVSIIAINSNDIQNYPDDSPENMRKQAEMFGFNFPYLIDESQEVAKSYKAACTPDFYVFDSNLKLAYRGQFDDSRPGSNLPVTGESLRAAIDALINDETVTTEQRASIGCNIKWKA